MSFQISTFESNRPFGDDVSRHRPGVGGELAFAPLPEPYIEIYDLIRLYES